MLLAEGLRHTFGAVTALDDVSFSVQPGQTLAVFGPNGAGKTTLLKVLAGLIRPQAGTTHVEGGPGAIGWMGHQAHLYGHLTVRENLLFWAALYDVPTPLRRARVDEALRRHGLADRADEPVHALSRGLVQRAGIARALLHEPRVLLLDGPVTGLDLARAVLAAVVFAALVLMVFNFGRDPTAVAAIDLAPSILWVTFPFAAMLALNRAFQLELENQALEGLLVAPISRTSIYWGKLAANLVFVAVVEAVGLPLFVLFFNVPVAEVLGPLVGVIALATVGFVAVGTLFSAMLVRTRFAELMLPVLLLPFLIPPLMGAVQVTARLLAARPLSEVAGWLRLLAAYDVVFLTLATLLFPHTVEQ